MTNRLLASALVVLVVAMTAGGCCCTDRYYYGNCSPMVLSGRGAGDCVDGSCSGGGCEDGSCGGAPACGNCGHCNHCCVHPLRTLWGAITCSRGCGDFYFDEWVNDPPQCCDPCDDCGSYVGPRDDCQHWFPGRDLLSYRYGRNCDTTCGMACGGDCGSPGCTGCGGGEMMDDGMPVEGEVLPTPMPMPMEPTPADMATRPVPKRLAKQPYYQRPVARRASYEEPARAHNSYSTSTRTSHYATPAGAVGTGVRVR